jgi:hypothetical protein
MPVSRTFAVTIYKAKVEGEFVSIELDIGGRNGLPQNVRVDGTVDDALTVARRLAAEYAQPCRAGIRLVSGRKPPGFDDATRGLFFNLDKPQATDSAAA